MKKVLFLIVAIVLPLSLSAQEKSLWMLHNRLTGAYVYDDGNVQSLALSPSGDTFLWTMESGEGDDFTITNLHTGRPLMCDDTFWVVGGYDFANMPNVGWYSLERTGKTGFLAVRGNRLVGDAADRVGDYSAHWSFVRVHSEKSPFVIGRDGVVESSFRGERTAKALSTTEMTSDYHRGKVWKLSQDISSFPQFTAEGNTLVPALYNLALEETLLDIRPQDSTFMAGMLWPDTWTRDVVYSIYFAYSWLLPDEARRTLEKQTLHDPDEALQDTGSGGSYPISTDRVVWALAAWEYYLATGDKDWLRQTYRGLSNTARKDLHVAYDHEIHLFRGETCSMDWRTHTYPNWFTNAHIGESFSCGTNALHLFLYRFLCDAGRVIGAPGDEISLWEQVHQELRDGINSAFWDFLAVFSPLFALIFTRCKDYKYWIFSISNIILITAVVFMGNGYFHYITLAWINVVLAFWLVLNKYDSVRNWKPILAIAVICVMTVVSLYSGNWYVRRNLLLLESDFKGEDLSYSENVSQYIPEDERDQVYCYFTHCSSWYDATGIFPCYKYCDWQAHYVKISKDIYIEIKDKLENDPPKWLITKKDYDYSNSDFLDEVLEKNYSFTAEDEVHILYKAKN